MSSTEQEVAARGTIANRDQRGGTVGACGSFPPSSSAASGEHARVDLPGTAKSTLRPPPESRAVPDASTILEREAPEEAATSQSWEMDPSSVVTRVQEAIDLEAILREEAAAAGARVPVDPSDEVTAAVRIQLPSEAIGPLRALAPVLIETAHDASAVQKSSAAGPAVRRDGPPTKSGSRKRLAMSLVALVMFGALAVLVIAALHGERRKLDPIEHSVERLLHR